MSCRVDAPTCFVAYPRYDIFVRLGFAAYGCASAANVGGVWYKPLRRQAKQLPRMDRECSYILDSGAPESFVKSCDVLLVLDDGSKLPAHSQILARFSRVCADMLDDGPLSDASTLNKAALPLPDCTRITAINLLSVLYSTEQVTELGKHITNDTSMAIAGLAHKLDMQVHFY